MPLSNAARLLRQRLAPADLMLWRALRPLPVLARFMNTGAHPDDETSAMLAALRFRDGLSIAYACSTRGEGGQNDIGREAGSVLGALRSAEMARACDVLDLRMHWLSEGPEDSILDFGFSKSGDETLARWTHARSLRRLVEVIRADRPDIICPTFLDVPGQHGHHRAMTRLAHEAMTAAADPGFAAAGQPWQVAKMYLPAWSGAGTAYDDDLPPPPETVRIAGAGREGVSGWTWAQIGEQSRAFHATQGMGRWLPPREGAGWPLHLVQSAVGPDRGALTDNLPQGFADLAPTSAACADLDAALAATRAAFPDRAAILAAAGQALAALRAAQAEAAPTDPHLPHRLARKEAELARVIRLASGIVAEGVLDRTEARPGAELGAQLALHVPEGPVTARAEWVLPAGWRIAGERLTLAPDAPPSPAYPSGHVPGGPEGAVHLALTLTLAGQSVTEALPLEAPLWVLPAAEVALAPTAAFVNLRAPVPVALTLSPEGELPVPEGWSLRRAGPAATLAPPPAPAAGLHQLTATRDGQPARIVSRIDHAHTGPILHAAPAVLRLRVAEVALPEGRIGYVGGGNDRVDHWLRAMGLTVALPGDDDLAPAALAGLDTLVIGIFAFKTRAALAARLPDIHAWVRAGGTLVTLYHRPWDNWHPATTPPAPLEIGQPSLRWRVTDAASGVTHLAPDHPVLTGPNRIGPEDWQGWVKERGLYFAKAWDPAYAPLVEMADPGEAPHRGALLSAEIGAGRHTHCALGLHLQMEGLVPGGFRLMANLIAPRHNR